ncbi:MAG TPA: type IV pilin protein [Woeseiaceae bacterium]|nr:type IV pilin protein [Woeseiaceae bacterium]
MTENRMYRSMRGVTLLELMIVVVVIGVLTSIAYPSYRDAAARAKRNEARAALLQIATNQERFYLNNNTYSGNLADMGVNATTETGTYAIAIDNVSANNFRATATYLKADAEAGKCANFTVWGDGTRSSAPLTDCWSRTR